MDTQEYILSGIVESYVLNLASDEERNEFEKMCSQYPEVLSARIDFETSLEKTARENAIAAPAHIKNRIFEEIGLYNKVVPIEYTPKSTAWLKYAAAACIIFLAGSLYYNYNLSNKNKELQTSNKKLKAEYDTKIAKLTDMENDMQLMYDPKMRMASMRGLEVSPQSFATVYWDTTSHDVYLLASNLPSPPGDKQYQLWALFGGKPIDLGMLDYTLKQKKLLVRMKNAQGAEAFAITLEKKGGNAKPEGSMYVMGKL